MKRYRVPSEILWVNDGWKEVHAESVDAALTHFRSLGWSGTAANVQLFTANKWQFASEISPTFGGYGRNRGEVT
jgi:hypothetical protein